MTISGTRRTPVSKTQAEARGRIKNDDDGPGVITPQGDIFINKVTKLKYLYRG